MDTRGIRRVRPEHAGVDYYSWIATKFPELESFFLPEQLSTSAEDWPIHKRLMMAIMVDAINVVYRGGKSRRDQEDKCFETTLAWLKERNPAWPFSFDTICDVFDLPTETVRRTLLEVAKNPPRPAKGRVKRMTVLH